MSVKVACDLRPGFGNARGQGDRPTCCAFACSDLHAARRPPFSPLSCEYAFHMGVRRQRTVPAGGVYLHHMLDVLEQDGQPAEVAWPYLDVLPTDLSRWTPPADVGRLFHARGGRGTADVAAVRAALDGGQPAVLITSVSDAFYFVGPDGVVDSDEPVDDARVHALVAVGHGTSGSDSFTLVRNSWGEGWGMAGHAWMSDRYLNPRLMETATVLEIM